MEMTPERLRAWILVTGCSLLAAIAAFFVYGGWQGRRSGRDFPARLNSSIQQSTNGFTYSESRGGHTNYTLHASKAVQYKSDGHAELHDVSITLYGAQGAPTNHIYGSDFDWDPVHGIARAMGEVQIDFEGAANPASQAGKNPEEDGENKNTVHVKTSGVVFNKQSGLVTTTERIEFRLAEAAGSAIGASFDSQTGIVILAADVDFKSSAGGKPLAVRAHHAQFDRNSRLLYLLQDQADYADTHSSSDQATVSFRADGSAYHVLAEGHVILTGSDGQQINTRIVNVDLGAKSEPQQAIVDGGVLYTANNPARQLHGSASSGTLSFVGPQATIKHAQLRDAVSLVDEEKLPPPVDKGAQNAPESSTRQMGASQVDVDFVPGPGNSAQAQHILAAGGARVNVHTIYAKTPPQDLTVLGDQLFATLADGQVLSSLRGTGHTSLVTVTPNGVTQSSKGDNLLLTFAEPPATKTGAKPEKATPESPAGQPATQLQSAVQSGNVTLIQQAAAAPNGQLPPPTTATAQRADYDAATQIMHLSGNPRIQQDNGELTATLMELEHNSGNATATGNVKATYRPSSGKPNMGPAGNGPVHVVADRADLDHKTDLATFYGKPDEPARLWQGSDSISAPVLELSRAHSTLSARGPGGEAVAVNAVFTSSSSTTPNLPNAAKTSSGPSVIRLQSRTLFYSENDHKATFSGAVVAQTSTALMHSNFMDVYFTPAPAAQPPAKSSAGSPAPESSQVSKIVARGEVQLEQPGRKGTGDQLIYTAADGKFVLSGTAAAPPHLSDQVRGTVTGDSLIFNDRDGSVVVSGGASKAVTQTRVAK
jgi:lipopolysaccharide export system protein LptA